VLDNPLFHNNFGINLLNEPTATGGTAAFFGTNIGYTNSFGTAKLSSANPDAFLNVNPNYLSFPGDKLTMALAINSTLQVIEKMGLVLDPNPCNATNCETILGRLDTFLLNLMCGIGDHWTSTAAMGRVTDPSTLKVYGTTGLYVIDASALPVAPDENTQNTVYAFAERASDLLIADRIAGGYWT